MRRREPPVLRVEGDPEQPLPRGTWPGDVPAVAQLLDEGLDLSPGVTFVVGENGTGKSTVVEAVARAYGLGPEGGSTQAGQVTRDDGSPLWSSLRLRRGIAASRQGFFLRAETMHGWYTFLEKHPQGPAVRRRDPVFHEMSHGESFLAVLAARFDGPGLYCLDEPEAALSFSSQLGLVAVLDRVARDRGQVLCATHSPLVASLPGARILEAGPWGLRETAWEDLDLVRHWRAFLEVPGRYLRHALDAGPEED